MRIVKASLRETKIGKGRYNPQLVLELECGCTAFDTRLGGWSLDDVPSEWRCVAGHEPLNAA